MSLATGTRLGPYEILAPLGAGGMGEVYRAKDTRLERTVAIKVLPSHFSQDSQRRERFELEAQTISSLNHPHICALYDVGQQDGTSFLVMEYLEGQTLAEALANGRLSTPQVLRYGTEIADALDKAHRQGIVHRDLKPGNVMLTKAGAKLLDFGLAKLNWLDGAHADVSQLATRAKPLTGDGALLGTFQYMAPEQLEGKGADSRTDIFALGSILYEMATGQRAFEGKSQASLIVAILEHEPKPMRALQPLSPPALERLVKVCLAKDPDDRLQTAHDVMQELKWITEGDSVTSLAPRRPRSLERLVWGLAVLAATAAGWKLGHGESGGRLGPRETMHLALTFSADAPLSTLNELTLALSPDGTRLVYIGGDEKQKRQLYVRSVNEPQSKPIPGTEIPGEQEGNPFFSPDGQWVGFFAEGKLKKVSLEGGSSVVLCDAPTGRGGSWGDNDIIVFAPSLSSGLSRVPAAGGVPEVLTRPDPQKGEVSHRWPQILPGAGAVIFTIGTQGGWDSARIAVQSLKTGERRTVIEGGFSARYLPSGHLAFARGTRLFAVPFDLASQQIKGKPIPVLDSVETNRSGGGAAEFVFSHTGSLLYLPAELLDRSVVWVDRSGAIEPVPAPPRRYEGLSLSPGGDRLALLVDNDIWIYSLERETLTRLTFGGQSDGLLWTPDGRRITFSLQEGAMQNLAWVPADGSAKPERLTTAQGGWQWPHAWSPDGRTLLFNATHPETDYDIWEVSVGDGGEARPFLQTPFDERDAVLSPNGKWVAYASFESGRPEIYVQAFPGPGGKQQISNDGGQEPLWARSGRELFYRKGGKKIMAVDGDTTSTFHASKPRMLFEGDYLSQSDTPAWSISLDGRRFLMIKPSDPEVKQRHLNVTLGWFEELMRLVPTGHN